MSKFFINRPVTAIVISILIVLGGIIMAQRLPIAQFPSIAPPEIVVTTNYVGADALTIESAVATPIEEAMAGVEGMLYMRSFNANDGTVSYTHLDVYKRQVEHEEVLSANEELQSTNEELETAKEELQSSNEELSTLNEELQNRNAELDQLANDLSNLLVGVSIPVIIVGGDRRIRRFTPAAEPLLNLIPTDVGRPISDIRPNIDLPDLDSLISEASGKGSLVEQEVQSRDGRWYSLRMRPYRTAENKIDGVLMALMDIDVLKRGLNQARLSLGEAVAERDLSASLLDISGALIVILDPAGRIVAFNHACQEKSGYSLREVKGRTFWDFLLPPEEVDEAKSAFARILGDAGPKSTYERTWIGKDGSRRVIASSSTVSYTHLRSESSYRERHLTARWDYRLSSPMVALPLRRTRSRPDILACRRARSWRGAWISFSRPRTLPGSLFA